MKIEGQTCGSCAHFDSLHQQCPKFTIRQPLGKVNLKRLPESPICRTEFQPQQEEVGEEFPSKRIELFPL